LEAAIPVKNISVKAKTGVGDHKKAKIEARVAMAENNRNLPE
jgi:hypothetical protein